MHLDIFLLVKKELKPITCMAFGYTLLLMAMSEIFPVTSQLTLTAAFFIPFMDKKDFLFMAFFQSLVSTIVAFIQRDLIRGFLLGVDLFQANGIIPLLLIYLLLGLAIVVDNPQILCALGFITILAMTFLFLIAANLTIVEILRLTGFYRRVGKICPKEMIKLWRK